MNKQIFQFINKLTDELYHIDSTKSNSSFFHDYSSKQIILRKCRLEERSKPKSMGGEVNLILHYTKNVSLIVDSGNIAENRYTELIDAIFRDISHTKKDVKYYLLPKPKTDISKELLNLIL